MINMINMINANIRKIRTVNLNERGQIVIPEDIRKDFGLDKTATLVMIEKGDEIVLRRESDVLRLIGEEKFWIALSREGMKSAWDKEDEVWDKIYKNLGK
ncbi:AbrB/MazE/SpoVT family DNA-binding domain-containing protein [Candidatus Woesearchaeota archaeon]|nr:AbrB/MazE/SpoVT family DNA-binding domain-containing protein [Candidatus Woesearchaeota archaeon]